MADLEKMETDLASGGWVRTAKDLFAGASGGITQVLLGMFVSFLYMTLIFCPFSKYNWFYNRLL